MYFDKSVQMMLMHTLVENHVFKWARTGARTVVSRNESTILKGNQPELWPSPECIIKISPDYAQDCIIKINRSERDLKAHRSLGWG